jgi:hypothetical protein
MKTVILAALGLAVPLVAAPAERPADVAPGAFQLTGNTAVGFESGSTRVKSSAVGIDTRSDFTELGFRASGLYFAFRNVGLGLSATYDLSADKSEGIEEVTTTLMIGPTISAQAPVGERVALFARGTFGFAAARTTTTDQPDLDAKGYGVELLGGLRYFVVPQFSIDGGISYVYTKLTSEAVETTGGTIPEMDATAAGLTVGAGLSVYFGR